MVDLIGLHLPNIPEYVQKHARLCLHCGRRHHALSALIHGKAALR